MGEHVVTAIERAEQKAVEETPAEEDSAAARPVSSPATPKQDIATPDPAPGPSFADVIRDWMQHEAAKRQEAEDPRRQSGTGGKGPEGTSRRRGNPGHVRGDDPGTTASKSPRCEEIIQMADTEYNKLDLRMRCREVQRDQALGMMKTLAQFAIPVVERCPPKGMAGKKG